MILTVTGLPGTDTRNLCKSLSLQLGIKYLPKETIIEKISAEEKKDREKAEADVLSEEFVQKLRAFILNEAKQDHLIVDWGLATWLMNEADLKVFVLSKEKNRALEMTRVKKVPFVEAKQEMEKMEEEERKNLLHLLGVNVHDLKYFDLVINADKLDMEGITGIIMKFMKNYRVK
ncbi:MAG: cytidylate kinase family protein [Candidatus Diapherotrites archaeon]|nr:cytidylate kinase family protein [Candidatus Diapherotrites archaeon]